MIIDTRIVANLKEYFECVNKICGDRAEKEMYPPVLWFRGLSDIRHSLIPSLFRTGTRTETKAGMDSDYSTLHYAEDIRTQHYIAKNFHFFQHEPSSRVEWLEVMQHHGAKTRVLDWSESSVHSLLFAIEPFLDQSKFEELKRTNNVPCVWVLEPAELNRRIFAYIKAHVREAEITELAKELNFSTSEKDQFIRNLEEFSDFDIYDSTKETSHLDYILNLNVINDEILRDRTRLRELLLSGDVVNPYYYIISRIYSDGHILKQRTLPPLAIVQSYHSERIKAQHGVFTVFPFYKEQTEDEQCRKWGLNPDAMENNRIAGNVLHKIIIENPQRIAYELMQNGMDQSWLYPEMPVVTNQIENREVFH